MKPGFARLGEVYSLASKYTPGCDARWRHTQHQLTHMLWEQSTVPSSSEDGTSFLCR